jgi:transposase
MQHELIRTPENTTKSGNFRLEELLQRNSILESELMRALRELHDLRQQKLTDDQIRFFLEEKLESQRHEQFGPSSERYSGPVKESDGGSGSRNPKPSVSRVKSLRERYPNIPTRTEVVKVESAPTCPCCGKLMLETGMMEESEQLTVIPKKYEIVKTLRPKHRCVCQGAIVTTPSLPRITPGSSYSDEMCLDVALSKYCDLIPMERYSAMADRGGLKGLPPQSLIELTHSLADFLSPAYRKIKAGVLESRVLHADETPHRMLEGSDKKSWFLWGFSTPRDCFFECHDTRSGDVASEVLVKSRCEVLVTDVYSGYGKAVRQANEIRRISGRVASAYCNAHARRYFHKSWPHYPETKFYLDHYHWIYELEAACRGQPPPRVLEIRTEMKPRFDAMRAKALEELPRYPEQSKYAKALKYFLSNWNGLTLFLTDHEVPSDNNPQERLLRSHVVGRKTWYGTHSERGALTAAVLFTLVETCKLNHLNPREYFEQLVYDLHAGNPALTPYELKQVELANAAAASRAALPQAAE